jgi:hypothetical protein
MQQDIQRRETGHRDVHGQMIHEGDIVENPSARCVVLWSETLHRFYLEQDIDRRPLDDYDDLEVIGTIARPPDVPYYRQRSGVN